MTTTVSNTTRERKNWLRDHSRPRGNRNVMPDAVDWNDPEQVAMAKWMCLQNTPEGLSFLARHVLGFDYWDFLHGKRPVEHKQGLWWSSGYHRTCGLVDWGEHRRMAAACVGVRDAVLFCSRNSNKTTFGVARCIQTILQNRNVRWIIYMATKDLAEKTVGQIRRGLEKPRLVQMFGEMVGDTWASDRFDVAGRTRNDRCMTVMATGAWATSVGDHCDVLWTDDPIDFRMARNPDRLKDAIDTYQQLQPLLDPGGWELFTLTPYSQGDFSEFLMGKNNKSRSVRKIVNAPCGMTAEYDRRGRMVLRGQSRFPRLTRSFLRHQLEKMQSVETFNRQYALQIGAPEDEVFRREDMIAAPWEPRFRKLSAYVLTDTASSSKEDACQSVIALVLMDWDATAYVVDLWIGKWKPSEFRDNVIAFIKKWQSETMMCGIAMERVTLNQVYRVLVEEEMRRHGITLPWIELPRGTQSDAGKQGDTKRGRIRAMEQRVRSRKLRFLEEKMTRSLRVGGTETPLYSSNGYFTVDGRELPSGEIVEQFVHWRDRKDYGGVMDIPDCLSAIDQCDSKGTRLLTPSSQRRALLTQLDSSPVPWSGTPHRRGAAVHRRQSFWERMQSRGRS